MNLYRSGMFLSSSCQQPVSAHAGFGTPLALLYLQAQSKILSAATERIPPLRGSRLHQLSTCPIMCCCHKSHNKYRCKIQQPLQFAMSCNVPSHVLEVVYICARRYFVDKICKGRIIIFLRSFEASRQSVKLTILGGICTTYMLNIAGLMNVLRLSTFCS